MIEMVLLCPSQFFHLVEQVRQGDQSVIGDAQSCQKEVEGLYQKAIEIEPNCELMYMI